MKRGSWNSNLPNSGFRRERIPKKTRSVHETTDNILGGRVGHKRGGLWKFPVLSLGR